MASVVSTVNSISAFHDDPVEQRKFPITRFPEYSTPACTHENRKPKRPLSLWRLPFPLNQQRYLSTLDLPTRTYDPKLLREGGGVISPTYSDGVLGVRGAVELDPFTDSI